MRDATPSRTALATAFLRAIHVHLDDRPPVLDDSVAWTLLPGYQRRFITRMRALSAPWQKRFRQKDSLLRAMRAHVCVRARYAEDMLAEARHAGIERYVVLAAGLDTFAYRQAGPPIAVLEVDHPATQRWKRDLLATRDVTVPAQVAFLEVNFEHETLADRWVDSAAPDFVSWLGVTYYLSEAAISATLNTIAARCASGTRLVLDYWCEAPLMPAGRRMLWSTRVAVALQQEPMHSFFSAEEIAKLAESAGWRVRENLSPADQDLRYLAGRDDHLSVPPFAYLLQLEKP